MGAIGVKHIGQGAVVVVNGFSKENETDDALVAVETVFSDDRADVG